MPDWVFPVGKVAERHVSTADFLVSDRLERAFADAFSGYWVALVQTDAGLAEALLVFENGRAIGAAFEDFATNVQSWGEDALSSCLSAMGAPAGVLDVVTLSQPQVGLIPAFYSQIRLASARTPKDLSKQIPPKYVGSATASVRGAHAREPTRFELFAKRGLAPLHRD